MKKLILALLMLSIGCKNSPTEIYVRLENARYFVTNSIQLENATITCSEYSAVCTAETKNVKLSFYCSAEYLTRQNNIYECNF